MSSKLGSHLLRRTIWTPKIPDDYPFLPNALATLHAKAGVTLSEAAGFPQGQPKAVINLAIPVGGDPSGPAACALVRVEAIRVLAISDPQTLVMTEGPAGAGPSNDHMMSVAPETNPRLVTFERVSTSPSPKSKTRPALVCLA